MNKTELWVDERGSGKFRLLNEITYSSNFKSVKTPSDMGSLESQLSVAVSLRDGWRWNGPWPTASFKILQNGEEVSA